MDLGHLQRVWQIARIKRLVYEAGLTNTIIERRFGYKNGRIYDCLSRIPNAEVEAMLAEVLGLPVINLFPGRYDKNGRQLEHIKSEANSTKSLADNATG